MEQEHSLFFRVHLNLSQHVSFSQRGIALPHKYVVLVRNHNLRMHYILLLKYFLSLMFSTLKFTGYLALINIRTRYPLFPGSQYFSFLSIHIFSTFQIVPSKFDRLLKNCLIKSAILLLSPWSCQFQDKKRLHFVYFFFQESGLSISLNLFPLALWFHQILYYLLALCSFPGKLHYFFSLSFSLV